MMEFVKLIPFNFKFANFHYSRHKAINKDLFFRKFLTNFRNYFLNIEMQLFHSSFQRIFADKLADMQKHRT